MYVMSTPPMNDFGRFIVVFKESATQGDVARYIDLVKQEGGQVKDEYTNVLKGFSATMPNSLAANFERNDLIEFIEPDTMVTIM